MVNFLKIEVGFSLLELDVTPASLLLSGLLRLYVELEAQSMNFKKRIMFVTMTTGVDDER